ncbi:baseplate hub protein [Acetobacter sp. LMG 32666]|uniref:baseplate hub protein n=1 Tax=Acetobacter sp. LMG 32666 TaxID=2959295 RepID=UPI0030C7B415
MVENTQAGTQAATLANRQVDVVFTLAQDGFGAAGAETITLSGYRVRCQIVSTGLESGMACALRLEGLAQPLLNRLSLMQAGMAAQTRNTVTIMAGNAAGQGGSTRPVVFCGGVVEAFVDYANSPDVAFEVRALSGALPAALPVAPTSFGGDVPVATVMQGLATKAGLGFANYGVQTLLRGGVYYKGSVAEQVDSCARAARISYQIGVGVLAIWPAGMVAQEQGQALPVSVATGLVGYPSYSQYGVQFQSVFNPNIRFRDTVYLQTGTSAQATTGGASTSPQAGAQVGTQGSTAQASTLQATGGAPPACGLWVVQNVRHDLQTERPDGPWFTTVEAARPDFAGQAFAR